AIQDRADRPDLARAAGESHDPASSERVDIGRERAIGKLGADMLSVLAEELPENFAASAGPRHGFDFLLADHAAGCEKSLQADLADSSEEERSRTCERQHLGHAELR